MISAISNNRRIPNSITDSFITTRTATRTTTTRTTNNNNESSIIPSNTTPSATNHTNNNTRTTTMMNNSSNHTTTNSTMEQRHDVSSFGFRAAIALNNMAVTMMERQNYRAAFDTLKSATAAIKSASFPQQQEQSEHDQDEEESHHQQQQQYDEEKASRKRRELLSMLGEASRRMSMSHHHQQQNKSKSSRQPQFTVPLQVSSHDTASPFNDQQCHASKNSSSKQLNFNSDCKIQQDLDVISPVFTVVRLETHDEDLLEAQYSSLIAATILYNFAVSFLVRAKAKEHTSYKKKKWQYTSSSIDDEQESASSATKYRDGGMKLLKFCSQLMDAQFETCDDIFLLPRVIYLSTVILRTLRLAFEEQGLVNDVAACTNTLHSLQQAHAELCESTHKMFARCSQKVAAAA